MAAVRHGSFEFGAHGLADIESGTPVTEDTVFRVASITKLFTAIAVMQLWERGLADLDAPANDYLRAYRLVPARPSFPPATVRQLLTHTAGIREVLHPSGLLRIRDLGETVPLGRRVPSLAEYYRGALRIDAAPGSRFMYTNHGYATLGQLVADVSGAPLPHYVREHILDPLGMCHSDLIRSQRLGANLATGYELRAHGAVEVAEYDVVPLGAGALYATARDMALFLAALLGGGTNEHGTILKPETLDYMYQPHHRPDARMAGNGLAFFRSDLGGRLGLEHDGVLPGFDSQLFLAPAAGVGFFAVANGARRGMHWLTPEVGRLLRRELGVPDVTIRGDVPHHPECWRDLCGWYRLPAHRTDPARFALGAGAEVFVRHGRLMLRFLGPIPALYKGFVLHPDDANDPYVFRVELPWLGVGTARVVFSGPTHPHRPTGEPTSLMHLEFGPLSLPKRPAATNPRRWTTAALAALGAGVAVTALRRRRHGRDGR
jgi:CubicO group peptidase (beta-lactamase class C family)